MAAAAALARFTGALAAAALAAAMAATALPVEGDDLEDLAPGTLVTTKATKDKVIKEHC